MKFVVLQENLLQALQDIQKSIPSRPSLPILGAVLMEVSDTGTLQLSATDLNIGVRSQTSCQVEVAGKTAVPARTFSEFVSSLSAGQLECSLVGPTLTVKSAASQATFQCFPAEDYPTFPERQGTSISLPASDFLTAIQQVSFAASGDEARPILTAVLLNFGESLEMVATDGFRLATLELPLGTPISPPLQLLIPAKGLMEVARIASKKKVSQVDFMVAEKLKQLFFAVDGVEILVRMMDGEFPPYQKIIPASYELQIEFSGDDFSQKLKTAMIFARDSSGIIRLLIQPEQQQLKILSSSTSIGTQESVMPIRVISGGEKEIAFNIKYLSDFLSLLKPENIWFGMNEMLKPALLRPAGQEKYRYIIMPFRVNQ